VRAAVTWTALQRGVDNLLLQLGSKHLALALSLANTGDCLHVLGGESRSQGDDRRARYTQLLRNGVVGPSLVRQQNDAATQSDLLGSRAVPQQSFER